MTRQGSLRVLVLSRNYPNNALPVLGLWVESLVRHSTAFCEPKVIAPTPYVPPVPGLPERYARFRRIEAHQTTDGIEVLRPRFAAGPGSALHAVESLAYYLGVRRCVDRLRARFPFDLIHAHFTYPDGVVAAWLGRRHGVPVVITEHASWRPWMERYPLVRRQATWAARHAAFHLAVSTALRDSILHVRGPSSNLRVVPCGVDGAVFAPSTAARVVPNQVLFVGAVRPVKGLDVLLRAIAALAERGADPRLVVVGESFYESYRREDERMRELAGRLGLADRVRFVGRQPPSEVARYMQESAVLVLPSRRESLGMVLAEALACGTPVVATRAGGPEDIVDDEVGVLVPVEDPEALAEGIRTVLRRRAWYDPARLRARTLERFGLEAVGRDLAALYRQAVGPGRLSADTLPGPAHGVAPWSVRPR